MINHSIHHPQWRKTESTSSKVRNKTRVATLTTNIQHRVGSFSHSNQRKKRNKRNPDWKRRSKPYTENSKDSIRKLLELISEVKKSCRKKKKKVAEYKINIQKSLAFLYTNN